MKLFQKLELAGLCLILASFAWQFFIDSQHDGILSRWKFEHIQTRLDEIHERQHGLQSNQIALAEALANKEKPMAGFVDNLKIYTIQGSSSKQLHELSERFRYVGAGIFILGSLLMIIGKALEYKVNNA